MVIHRSDLHVTLRTGLPGARVVFVDGSTDEAETVTTNYNVSIDGVVYLSTDMFDTIVATPAEPEWRL